MKRISAHITRGEEAMATAPRSGHRQDQRVGLEDGRGFKGSEATQVLFDTPQQK